MTSSFRAINEQRWIQQSFRNKRTAKLQRTHVPEWLLNSALFVNCTEATRLATTGSLHRNERPSRVVVVRSRSLKVTYFETSGNWKAHYYVTFCQWLILTYIISRTVSKLSHIIVQIWYEKPPLGAFLSPPLGRLGATHAVHLQFLGSLEGKPLINFVNLVNHNFFR